MRPEQLLTALPRAVHVLSDPARCGPVTLAFPQDVQTMAYDWPVEFLSPPLVGVRAQPPDADELAGAAAMLRDARRPLIVAGGGALYSGAADALRTFAERHGVPVTETQAGKSVLPWDHPLLLGAAGVTGSTASAQLGTETDLLFAVGTRLQDFTTGSHAHFTQAARLNLNVQGMDAIKWRSSELVADARVGLDMLSALLGDWRADAQWTQHAVAAAAAWREEVLAITGRRDAALPYEGEVIGAVQRSAADSPAEDIVVCAAGTLPAELHKLWRAAVPGTYHVEYGYSCMGYEIAGGVGVKMARPEREVIVILGDGSYLMLNSEIATAVMLGLKLVIVVLDNGGFGCIDRLQQACGGAPFNNLLVDCMQGDDGAPQVDFAAHARALGARGENVEGIAELEAALHRARAARSTTVICIRTDPRRTTEAGGVWWEVAVPEVSDREAVRAARAAYDANKAAQRV